MAKRFILTIDGGGVRGLVAAIALRAFQEEREVQGKTAPLTDCFDLVAGTSTGAIIAAGLTAPLASGARLRSKDMVALFQQRSREIFPPKLLRNIPVIGRFPQLFGPLHDPASLQGIIEELLGDIRFSELPRNLLIPAYSINPRTTLIMRGGPDYNNIAKMDQRYGAVRVADAVIGSAAAPTFFPPHQIDNFENSLSWTAIDGAVYLNDPSMTAYAEARRLYPGDDIYILSLGTGRQTRNYPFTQAARWGFGEWISPTGRFRTPLLSSILDGQAQAVNQQLMYLLGERYVRMDYRLEKGRGSDQIDDASPRNIRELTKGAEKMVAENRTVLKDFVTLMAS